MMQTEYDQMRQWCTLIPFAEPNPPPPHTALRWDEAPDETCHNLPDGTHGAE